MPNGEESCTSREHRSSEEQVWSWSTTSDTISDALSTEAEDETNGISHSGDHRRSSAALTLSAETCGGVALTEAGLSCLLFDAGGYL